MNISQKIRAALRCASVCAATLAISLGVATHAGATSVDEIVKRGTVKIGVLSGVPIYGTVDEKAILQATTSTWHACWQLISGSKLSSFH
ncbi:hypothetical protein LP417_28475 [Polaromonas sp. P1-6]|nr:hypothetical protein LP417_28475 [Polaromonas sp. P1-6]